MPATSNGCRGCRSSCSTRRAPAPAGPIRPTRAPRPSSAPLSPASSRPGPPGSPPTRHSRSAIYSTRQWTPSNPPDPPLCLAEGLLGLGTAGGPAGDAAGDRLEMLFEHVGLEGIERTGVTIRDPHRPPVDDRGLAGTDRNQFEASVEFEFQRWRLDPPPQQAGLADFDHGRRGLDLLPDAPETGKEERERAGRPVGPEHDRRDAR